MTLYRVYLLDERDHISAREEYEAATDAEALAVARKILASYPDHCNFELWSGQRRVSAAHEAEGSIEPAAKGTDQDD
jgi:hypothetical protein